MLLSMSDDKHLRASGEFYVWYILLCCYQYTEYLVHPSVTNPADVVISKHSPSSKSAAITVNPSSCTNASKKKSWCEGRSSRQWKVGSDMATNGCLQSLCQWPTSTENFCTIDVANQLFLAGPKLFRTGHGWSVLLKILMHLRRDVNGKQVHSTETRCNVAHVAQKKKKGNQASR